MTLINTEGMTFIGPGSEWFWTAVSGVVLALTFLAIYRQLRLQRDAAAIEQVTALARDWLSEPMARHRAAILTALRDGGPTANVPRWANRSIGNFWERIGFLVRSGHMDERIVHETFADIGLWWRWLATTTRAVRVEWNNPKVGEHFEWLAARMDELDRSQGISAPDAAGLVSSTLEANLEAIRAAEELRAVIVRAPSTPAGRSRRRASVSQLVMDPP
jgi:hypothetical protein